MAWNGISMGLGITLVILGAIGLVVGAGIAIVGPEAVSDESCCQDDHVLFGGDDRHEERTADERNEVRAAGATIAAIGGGLMILGGLFYAIARGVEAARTRKAQGS